MKIKILVVSILLTFVGIKSNAQCGVVSNLTHNFSSGVNSFSWNSVPLAVDYQLEIIESGAYAAIELLTVTTDTSFVTPGGLLSASYDWRIISTCQNGDQDTSAFSTFTIPCPEPSGLIETNITQTSTTLHWLNPYFNDPMYGNSVILAYRPVGGVWINLSTSVSGNSWVLNNLSPNTTYEWCVNLNCAYYDSNPVISTFTTLGQSCPNIISQSAINVTNTTAQLSWSNMGGSGAIGYILQYKLNTNNIWTTITIGTNTSVYTCNSLTPNSTYQFRVATLCAGGSMSNYSSPSTFQTNCVNLNNNIEHIRLVQIKDKIRVSTAEPNGYSMWNDAPTLIAGSSYTFKIAGGGQINNGNRQDVALFIDLNQNNIFEQSERVAGVGMLHNTNAKSFSFTVPANTMIGTTRARVVMLKQNQGNMVACPSPGSRGEIEDYEVNILPAPSSLIENTINATQSITTETESREKIKNILIYPNPTDDYIYIQGLNLISVEIFNSQGQFLYSKNHTGKDEFIEFDVNQLQKGILIIKTMDVFGNKGVSKHIKN